jgi:hypothetical protein
MWNGMASFIMDIVIPIDPSMDSGDWSSIDALSVPTTDIQSFHRPIKDATLQCNLTRNDVRYGNLCIQLSAREIIDFL